MKHYMGVASIFLMYYFLFRWNVKIPIPTAIIATAAPTMIIVFCWETCASAESVAPN